MEASYGTPTPNSVAPSSTSSPILLSRLNLQGGRDQTPPAFGVEAPPEVNGSNGEIGPALLLPSLLSHSSQPAFAALGRHVKHIFVFSSAGKPIFSHHGSEEDVAELMATAKALMSVVQARGESLRYIRSGRHVVAFLDRSPLCLVAVSALAEPPAVLRMQLALVHGQITSLLTASALAAVFVRTPGYDARKLLGSGDAMLRSLTASFLQSPAALLGAYPSLPMPQGDRGAVAAALQAALQASSALFGLVVSAGHVVTMAAAFGVGRRPPLQQWDVLLLLNFLQSNDSFKQTETFSPICLPTYNPNGNLHAYIQYVNARTSTAIVLLAGGHAPDFHVLSAARQEMQARLESAGALQAVLEAASEHTSIDSLICPGNLPEQAGGGAPSCTPLLHFAYKLTQVQQFVMSPFMPTAAGPDFQQDAVVAYSQLRAAMFDSSGEHTPGPLQRMRYEARHRFVVMASCGVEAELYLVLDPLTDKESALRACSRLYGWLRSHHSQLFHVT